MLPEMGIRLSLRRRLQSSLSGFAPPPQSSAVPDVPERKRSDAYVAQNGVYDEIDGNRQDKHEQNRQGGVRQQSKSPNESHDRHAALEHGVVACRLHAL